MTRKKKLSVVLFAVLLCFILAFSLAACVDDPGDKKTHNETVRPYINELSKALSNSISADLANGFYAGFAGSVKIGNDEYSFDFDANILSKDKEGEEAANNNFRLVVKKADTVLFGLYNDKTNLYLEQGENKYNFANASVMKALRSVLVANIPNFSELTNLDAIEVMGSDLKSFVEDTMPLMFLILCQDPNEADTNANLMVGKEGDTYKVTIDLSNISSLGGMLGVGDLDLSFLEGIKVNLDVKVESEAIKKIDVSLAVGGTNYAVSVTSKSTGGLFGAVKDDLDAQVPEALKAVEESSVIQTDFAGKINVNVKGESGTTVLKTLDWKFVSKIDLFDLVDKNFVFSELAKGNFFHFQLSHKCDEKCGNYCATNLVSANSIVLGDRFKNTSIVDIAWDPSTMETNNILVDISLWDLLTVRGLEMLLSDVTGMDLTSIADLASSMISSQIVLSIDPDTVLLADNTVARAQEGDGSDEDSDNESAGLSIDIMKVLSSVAGLGGISDNALNVNIDGIKNLVESIAGTAPIAGSLTIAKALDYALDTANGVTGFSFTIKNNKFGHNAKVAGYDTYRNAVQYNANGKLKLATYGQGRTTPYGGVDMGNQSIDGAPALTTTGVTMTNGFLNIYAKDSEGNYVIVADDKNVLTNYDIEVVYGGMKNLYFEYTYLDFNKNEKTAYGSIFGFNGLNLNTTGAQAVTLLASPMTGESISATIEKNLMSILNAFPGLSLEIDLNLEKLIPIVADTFEVKVNFDAAYMPEKVQFSKDYSNNKFIYQIDEALQNKAHVEFNVGAKRYSFPMVASDNIVKDIFGQNKPGDYVITYSIDDKYRVTFENDAKTVVESIQVDAFKGISFEKNEELKFTIEDNSGLKEKVLGTAKYTLRDGTVISVKVKWKDIYNKLFVNDGNGEILSINDDNVTFTEEGKYTFKLRYSEVIVLPCEINVIGIEKIEASQNDNLKLYQGDNRLNEAGGIQGKSFITLVITYTDGSTRNIGYRWGESTYKGFTITDANGSTEGISAESSNLAFAHAGKYTFKVTYAGEEYSAEYEVFAVDTVEATYNDQLLVITGDNYISGAAAFDWWFVKLNVSYVNGDSKTFTYTWSEYMDLYKVTNKATGGTEGIARLATNRLMFTLAGDYNFALVFLDKEYVAEVTVYEAPEVKYTKNEKLIPAKAGITGKISLNGLVYTKVLTYGDDYAKDHDGNKEVKETVSYRDYMRYYFTVTKNGVTSGSVSSNNDITFRSAGIHTVTFTDEDAGVVLTWTIEVVEPIREKEFWKDYTGVFTVGVARDCVNDVLYTLENVYEDTSLNQSVQTTFFELTMMGDDGIVIMDMMTGNMPKREMGMYYTNTKLTFTAAGTYSMIFMANGAQQIITIVVEAAA